MATRASVKDEKSTGVGRAPLILRVVRGAIVEHFRSLPRVRPSRDHLDLSPRANEKSSSVLEFYCPNRHDIDGGEAMRLWDEAHAAS